MSRHTPAIEVLSKKFPRRGGWTISGDDPATAQPADPSEPGPPTRAEYNKARAEYLAEKTAEPPPPDPVEEAKQSVADLLGISREDAVRLAAYLRLLY